MSDPRPTDPPPRVEVRLPGGRTLPGRLLAWRQGPDGAWWAQAIIQVPAAAIRQVAGEDYTAVPREPAPRPSAGGYVLAADTRPGQPRTAVLHAADCWTLGKAAHWTTITPVDDPDQARALLLIDDTTACDACGPEQHLPTAP
ncbi:DUF6233 domain-containing protein [Streptomyces sp. V4-01]|uniref:DUF6233 domain-containing protein n=1 Tax=Actinacidiphila polyblastidii TaxID=3110430 RepID=A0ABU7PKX7_9ACTN|nr:DUF6233 domain-containing protein [Streptomyces sp. V4-01]